MAKYELEIDETTACRLCGTLNHPTAAELIEAAQLCLLRYAGNPELVTQRHLAALAIVRANIADQAQISDHQSHSQAAGRLLDFVLEGW